MAQFAEEARLSCDFHRFADCERDSDRRFPGSHSQRFTGKYGNLSDKEPIIVVQEKFGNCKICKNIDLFASSK